MSVGNDTVKTSSQKLKTHPRCEGECPNEAAPGANERDTLCAVGKGGVTVALKKSDLYSSLWAGADELRGGMDASQYKDYVLTLLFVKYVSDKAKADPYADVEVPEGGSFNDLVALKGQPDIGERVNVAIRRLADANDLQGVINNADFDDPDKLGKGKELVDRITKLIGIFQDLDFTGSRAEGDDMSW